MCATLSYNAPFECVLHAFRDHESELRGYLLRRVSDKHLADDLLQEVFVRALRSGQGFCGLDNPRAWLFQVARNALVDQRRLEKHAVPLPDDLVEKSEDGRPVDALSECLARVLSELPAADREILQQCDIDGVKQQAFADAHRLSLSAVKSRLLRARQRLREFMVRKCQIRFDEAGNVCCHVPRP
jgi:RNA polymerase sigma-70 factor (ECF subfamily)